MCTQAVVDNVAASRFELRVGDAVAFVAYHQPRNDLLVLTQTLVPPALRGQGIGQVLVRGTLDAIGARGSTIIPECPFIARFVAEHDAYQPMVNLVGQETPAKY